MRKFDVSIKDAHTIDLQTLKKTIKIKLLYKLHHNKISQQI